MFCPRCQASLPNDARFCAACGLSIAPTSNAGTPQPVPAADFGGREIAGRYRLQAKLGEGGMGAVYRAEQISLRRTVAVKVLRPELSADAGLVRRFNTEAELAAKLSHPNTVAIFDFGQDVDGTLYIAMEYVEGTSLRAEVQRGPIELARAVHIARQIAASLSDAHARGIVHRDLKPDNVMLTRRGREVDVVRVLDFGIAKLREDGRSTQDQLQQQMTQAGDMLGTPQYMAPEQIKGEAVDGRTDVYALGAILYEMVTGRMPFEGNTVMAILSKHLTELPPQPSLRRPDLGLPAAIDAVVMRALIKDVGYRTASMDRLAEELDGVPVPTSPYARPSAAMGGAPSAPMPAAGGWRPPGVPSTPVESSPGIGVPAAPVTPPPAYAPGAAAAAPRLAPIVYAPGAPGAPSTVAPVAAAAWAPPAAGVATPAPAPRPAPASSHRGLYIGLAVLAAAGIGVGIWAVTSSGSAGPSGPDPWTRPPPSGAAPMARPVVPPPKLDGTPAFASSGWGVLMPPGFVVQASPAGLVAVRGSGEAIACNDIDPSLAYDLDVLVADFEQKTQTKVDPSSKSMERLLGGLRPHASFVGNGGIAEAVAIKEAGVYFVCSYAATPDVFNAQGALRAELFQSRLRLPGAAMATP